MSEIEVGEYISDEPDLEMVMIKKVKHRKRKKSKQGSNRRHKISKRDEIAFDPYYFKCSDDDYDDFYENEQGSEKNKEVIEASGVPNQSTEGSEESEKSEMMKIVEEKPRKVIKIKIPRCYMDDSGLDQTTDIRQALGEMKFNEKNIDRLMCSLEGKKYEPEEDKNTISDITPTFTAEKTIISAESSKVAPRMPYMSIAATNIKNVTNLPDMSIIESIPPVAPTDPRLTKNNYMCKREISSFQKPFSVSGASKETGNRNWNLEVYKIVERYLEKYLNNKTMTHQNYEIVLKKAVSKITETGEHKLNLENIEVFLKTYVDRYSSKGNK